jgi:AcrR family transcriptional regulator
MSVRRIPGSERRAQLLQVARTVFAREGYRGATTLGIAREAGVSETLVLKHFGTKESLFRAAVMDPIVELVESKVELKRARLDGELPGVAARYQKIRAFVQSWCRLVRQDRSQVVSLIAELREFPDASERLLEVVRSRVDELASLIGRGARRSPRYRAYDARVSTYVTLAAATIAAFTEDDPEPFLDEFVKILFLGVLSDQGRAELLENLG